MERVLRITRINNEKAIVRFHLVNRTEEPLDRDMPALLIASSKYLELPREEGDRDVRHQ